MLDFTEGWMWLVAGLGATLLVALIAVALAVAAGLGEDRRGRRPPGLTA